MNVKTQKLLSNIVVNGSLAILCLVWTLPTFGLLITSFRHRNDVSQTGWWAVFKTPTSFSLTEDAFENLKHKNISEENMKKLERLKGREFAREDLYLDIVGKQIGADLVEQYRDILLKNAEQPVETRSLSLDNYRQVLAGKDSNLTGTDGEALKASGDNLGRAFLNSVTVVVPSVVIPILIAAFAAYGFAWMEFPGRKIFFVIIVALLVVPLQIALIPIMKDYMALQLNGTYLAVWLAHTGFGLPMATYLMFTYISQLPRAIFESAFIDGASHFTIFIHLILPLSVPAIASFAIFQFLWVWNDLLIAIVFLGTSPDIAVLTQALLNMIGSRGEDWHLLTAGAFISMALPLTVFFSLQRYFVKGLLTGSVKG